MSEEERARQIVVDIVRQIRVTGADPVPVFAVALRHFREIRSEEREACAQIAEDAHWCEEAFCTHHEARHAEQEGEKIAAEIRRRK